MSSNNNTVITENVFPANDTSTIGTNTSQFEEVNTKHCRAGRLSNKRHSKIRHAKGGKIRSTSVGGKRYKTGSPYTDSSSSSEDDHPKPVDPCPPLHGQHRKCVDLSTCDECYKLITNGNNVSAQPGTVTLDQTNNRLWVNPVNALGNDLTNYFLKLGSDLCVRITDVHHPDNNAIYQLSSFHQVNANLFCATTLLLTDKNLDQDCVFFKGHDSVKLCFKGGAGGSGGAGPTGPTGPTGADGAQGSPGQNGQDGADGAPGAQGPTGATGADGQDGQDGADGAQGPTGADGAQGPPGQDGQDGADGAPGAQGPTGAQGPAGQDGQDGADGAPGAQGPTGAAGPAGQDGADGAPGEVGPTGPPGPVGDIDILTNVSTSGVTSGQHLVYDGVNWTNQDSCLVDLCDVAIVGATGLQDGQVLAWKASTSRFENDFAFNLPGQLGGVNNEGDTGLSTEQTSAGGTGPNLTATNQKTLELNGDISITQEFTKDVNGKLSEYHEVEEMTQQVDETGPISSAPISAVKNELTEVTEEGTVGVDLKKVRKQTDAIKIDNDEVAVKESGLKKNFDQSTTLTSAGSLKQNNANGKDMTYDLTIEQQVQTGVRRDGRVFDIVTHGLSGNAVEVGAVASVVETTDVTRGVRNVVEREIGSEINNITKESVSKKSLGETFTKDRANYTKAGPARADTMISHSNVVSDASQSSGSKSRTFKDVGTGNNVIDRDLSRSGTLNAVKSTRTRNGRTTELHTVVGNGNFDGYDGTIELEDELDGTTRALNRKCVRAAFGGEDEVDLTHRTRDTTGTKKKTNVVKAGPARVDTIISQSETNYDASQSSGSKSRTFKDVGTGNNVIDRDLSRSGTLNAVKSTRTRNGRTTELHTVVGNGNFDGYDGTIELEDELDGTTRALNRKCVRAAFGGEDEVDLTHRTRDTTGTKKKTNVVKAGPARVDTVISQSETNYDASQSSGSKSRTFKDVSTGNNVIDRDLSRSGTLNAVKSTRTRNGRTTELHTVVGNGNFDGYDGTIELEDELDGTTRALNRKCVRAAFGGEDEVDLTHRTRDTTGTKKKTNVVKAGPARVDTVISQSETNYDASQSSGSKSRTFKDVGTGNNVIDRDLSRSGTLNAVKSTRTRNGRTTELHTVVGNGNFDGYDGTIELEDELDGTTRALNRKCVRAAFGGEDEVDLTHRTRDTTGTKKKTNVVKAGPARVDTVISQSETNYDASQSSGSKSRTFKDVGTGNNVIDRDLSRSGTLNAVKSTGTRNGRTTELHTVVGNGNFDGYDGTIELEDELDGTTRALTRKCVRGAFGGDDEVDLTHTSRSNVHTKKSSSQVVDGARGNVMVSDSQVVKQDGNTQITHKWYSGNTARSRAIRAVDYATYHNSAEFGTYASRIVNGVGSSVLQTAGGAFTSWTDVNGTETFNANNGATVEDAGVRFLLTDGLTSSRIDVGGGAVVSAAGSGVYFAGILSLNDASNDNGVFLDFTASDTVPAATDLRVVYDADLGGAGANPFLKFEVDGTTFGSMPTSGIEGLLFLAFTIDNSGNLNIYFNDEPVQAVPDVGGKLAAVQFRYLTLGRNLVASDPGSVESAIAELAVASAIGTDVTAINTVLGQQWGLLPGPSELQISTNVTTQSTRGRYSRATGNEIAVAGTNNTLIGCYRESVDPGGNENEVEITAACKLMEAFIDESELAPELQSGGGGSRNGRNVFQKIVNVFNNLQNQINNMSGGSGNPPGGQFTVNFNTLISELGGSAAIQDVLLLNDNGGNGEFDTIQVDYLDNGGSPVTRYLFVNPTYCNITNVASNDPSPGEYSFTTTNNQLEFAADSTNNPIGGSPATFWTVTNDPLLVWNPVASSGTQVALSQNFEVTEGEPDFQVEYRHLLQVSGSGAALDMVNTSTTTITDDTAVVDLDDGKSVNLVYDRTIVGVGNGVNEFHLTFAVPASQYSPGNQPVNFLSLNHGLPPPSFSVTYDGNTFTGTPIQLNDKNIDVDVTASY